MGTTTPRLSAAEVKGLFEKLSNWGRWGKDDERDGIVSRGVLLAIARLKNVEWMALGERVFPEDLDAAERAHRVRVEEGDVLLVRTGRMARQKKLGAWDSRNEGMAGLDPSCLPW